LLGLTLHASQASAAVLTQGPANGGAGGGTCLDVAFGSIKYGTKVGPVTCSADLAEQVVWNYPFIYTIGGRCLDTAGSSTSSGSAVVSNKCNANTSTQNWYYFQSSIVNVGTGECLDTLGAVGHGASLFVEPCSGAVSQTWQIK
jgi:hypothetical protein